MPEPNRKPNKQQDGREFFAAAIAPSSFDAEKRTVDCVFFTGIDVPRYDYWKGEPYILRFNLDGADLSLLNNGAPVFDNHDSYMGAAGQKGVVEKAWRDGNEYKATLRFSRREEVNGLVQDIRDGIVQKFSMGVNLLEKKELAQEKGKLRVVEVTKWQPFEISVAPLPADNNTRTLSAEGANEAVRATSPEEAAMPEKLNAGEGARTEVLAERQRISDITQIGAKHGLAELAAEHIGKDTTVEQFRTIALDALAERQTKTQPGTQTHTASIARDQRETLRAALPQAIMAVQGLSKISDKDPGYEYRSLAARGPIAIAEECAIAMGHNTRRMSRDEIVRLAMVSTSDLPLILGATADSALRAGYASDPKISQWEVLAARRVVSNFRPQYELMASVTANFPQVPESGEYKTATITEGRETYRLYTYGNKLLVTRQVMVNDSLGALTDIPFQMGAEAAQAKATLFWNWVIANGNLVDGTAVFAAVAARGTNLINPGTAISVDSLGVARKTLALQKNQAGRIIGLTPQYMVVPATKEQIARQYLSNAFNPATPATINPWAGMSELIVEPKLDASSTTAWYMFANPAIAPVFVQVYLAGNEGVFSQSEQTVDIDGFKWLMRFDFGVGSVDYRGAVKNLGA